MWSSAMRMHGKCTCRQSADRPIRMPDQITVKGRRASDALSSSSAAEAERQWFDEGRSAGECRDLVSAGAGAPLQVGSGLFQQRFDGRGLAQALEVGVLSGN